MVDYDITLRNFVKAMKDAQTAYNFYKKKVEEYNGMVTDITHQIEIGKYDDRNKFATKLAHVTRERRYAKDMESVLEPMAKYATENSAKIKEIERLLGDVRNKKDLLKNREYKPRVIKDLPISSNNGSDKSNKQQTKKKGRNVK